MMLYHGTSERNLKVILKKGLLPRSTSKRRTNWDRNPSHPEAVYLTNAYAGFYANASCKGRERWAILEIDTDKLSPFAFAPDEDFLEQAGRKSDGIPGDIHQRLTALREDLDVIYGGDLESKYVALSLKHLGNCTYFGAIPLGAISRIALVDTKVAKPFVYWAFDPCILLMNYAVMGASYRNTLNWLFGKPLETDPVQEQMEKVSNRSRLPPNRDGIEIIERCNHDHGRGLQQAAGCG